MKGHTNNPKGRPAGKPNKVTADLRQRITTFLEDQWQTLETEFSGLEAKDKLVFFERLLQYSLPKLQATTLTTNLESLSEDQLNYIINSLLNSQKDGQSN